MTSREKALVTALGVVALAAGAAAASTLWFDEVARLEAEHQSQRLAAARVATQALAGPLDGAQARSLARLEARFWDPGQAPSVLEFSTQVRNAARRAGLGLSGLRVVEEAPGRAWVQVQAEGPIGRWLGFLGVLTQGDPKVLFRRVLAKKTEDDDYSYTCEVGYASLP